MSTELAAWPIIKWLLGIVVGIIGWFTTVNHKKLQDTYSKQETDKQIDLKVDPIKEKNRDSYERLEDKMDLKFQVISDLITKQRAEDAETMKENTHMLHTISNDVAVIKSDLDNLKERVSENSQEMKQNRI